MCRYCPVWIEEQGATRSKQRNAGRKLFMISEERLTKSQQQRVFELTKQYPKTGHAFRMVQSLDAVYRARSYDEAEALFKKLVGWLKRSRLEPMKSAAKTLAWCKDSILEYFNSHLTNAIVEGINSLIQAAKRKARGFKTFRGYRNMIFRVCGKLKPDTVPLFG